MPNFFIDRPVFAWVIAILISLGGVLAILNLGVESYPNIAPPSVTVSATYPGASADTTEKTVTQVIEQQLTGIDHLLYFSSSSSTNGRARITLTFESGTDPDIAQVQVQNKVALATPRLPSEVTQQGVVVAKANSGFLMLVALRSDNPNIDRNRLNDIVGSQVLDQISRVPGVGSTNQFGSEYAMVGLGCDPHDRAAFERLFALKQRPSTQGVLLIGADYGQVERYIDLAAVPAAVLQQVRASWPGPHTWIFPRSGEVPDWIVGEHAGIALRVTAHAPAAALCRAFGAALVSTSANPHGQPPARAAEVVARYFGDALDGLLEAPLGGQRRPTVIREIGRAHV